MRRFGGGRKIEQAEIGTAPKVFLNGAYRLHRSEDIERFTALAAEAFPEFSKRITCFGADWLGNQFATDEGRTLRGDRLILLLEPGTGEVLEIPAGLSSFHDRELLEQADAVSAYGFFKAWLAAGGDVPRYSQCVGYKVPLYLGGADDLSNIAMTDFEVYWGLSAQLLQKVRSLPPGAKIGNVTMRD